MRLLTPLLATAALGLAPAAANADAILAPSPGATNLASGGGYLAWAAPAPEGGFQITVRAPDGTVSVPAIPRFATAPDPAIGSDRTAAADRGLRLVYSRGGDIVWFDLRNGGAEQRMRRASTAGYEEYSPSLSFGQLTFARRGGARNGIFVLGRNRLRRVANATPSEISGSASRVAYPSGNRVVIRRLSGEGRPSVVAAGGRPFGLVLTRYSLKWLTSGGVVRETPRFGGSSQVDRVTTARTAGRRLPDSTTSIGLGGTGIRYFTDAEGVKTVSPALRFG